MHFDGFAQHTVTLMVRGSRRLCGGAASGGFPGRRKVDLHFCVGVRFAVGAASEAVCGGVRVEEVVCDVGEFSQIGQVATFALLAGVEGFFGGVEPSKGFGDGFSGAGFHCVVTEVENVGGCVGGGIRGFAIEEQGAFDAFEGSGGGVDGGEERLEDAGGQALEMFGYSFLVVIVVAVGVFGGEIVHDQQRGEEILQSSTVVLRPFHALENVLAQTVLFDAEMQRGPARGEGQTEIGVAGGAAGEEHQVGDAQRTGHGGVVAQSVTATLLQTRRRVRLHHRAHVFDQLRDGRTNIAGSYADDH